MAQLFKDSYLDRQGYETNYEKLKNNNFDYFNKENVLILQIKSYLKCI